MYQIDDERKNMLQWISARSPMIPTSDLEFLIGDIPTCEPDDDEWGDDDWG